MHDGPDDPRDPPGRPAGATIHPLDAAKLLRERLAGANPAAPSPGLVLIDPTTWTSPAPARRWTVPDWIPQGSVSSLYGDGGIGKSLLAQQLLTSVATHLQWCGLDVAAGRAIGFFCEDDAGELQRRQEAINHQAGIGMGDLGRLRLVSRVGHDNALIHFEGSHAALTPLYRELSAECERFKPGLIVVDTAADTFPDNENDRAKVRTYLQTCLGSLARDHDCAVVLCAHPSVAGLTSGRGDGGSTGWNNTVRSRLYLHRPDDEPDDVRVLTRKKSNYAASGVEIKLRRSGGVFVPDDNAAPTGIGAVPWPTIRLMFDALDEAWKAGKPWSYTTQSKTAGRYFPAYAQSEFGIPLKTTETLISGWLMHGYLSADRYDRNSKGTGLRVVRKLPE